MSQTSRSEPNSGFLLFCYEEASAVSLALFWLFTDSPLYLLYKAVLYGLYRIHKGLWFIFQS